MVDGHAVVAGRQRFLDDWSLHLPERLQAAVAAAEAAGRTPVLAGWDGIAAVVLTVGLGRGAQQQVSRQLAALGGNLLIVTPGSSTTGGVRGGFGSASSLTTADATALPDSADADALRRLRVSLRWARRTRSDTGFPDAG